MQLHDKLLGLFVALRPLKGYGPSRLTMYRWSEILSLAKVVQHAIQEISAQAHDSFWPLGWVFGNLKKIMAKPHPESLQTHHRLQQPRTRHVEREVTHLFTYCMCDQVKYCTGDRLWQGHDNSAAHPAGKDTVGYSCFYDMVYNRYYVWIGRPWNRHRGSRSLHPHSRSCTLPLLLRRLQRATVITAMLFTSCNANKFV